MKFQDGGYGSTWQSCLSGEAAGGEGSCPGCGEWVRTRAQVDREPAVPGRTRVWILHLWLKGWDCGLQNAALALLFSLCPTELFQPGTGDPQASEDPVSPACTSSETSYSTGPPSGRVKRSGQKGAAPRPAYHRGLVSPLKLGFHIRPNRYNKRNPHRVILRVKM